MTFTTDTINQAVQTFQGYSADDQLAILWFIYTEIKDSLNPSSNPNETGFEIAQATVDQIQQMPREQQLQAQRNLIQGSGGAIADSYANFNSSNRLAFWYLLAQGMERDAIVTVPADYNPSSDGQSFLEKFKGLDFEGKITFMRTAVAEMGNRPKPGAVV